MTQSKSEKVILAAEKFVENLTTEGAKVACDEFESSFKDQIRLPHYYNEDEYHRGCKFYKRHIFGMFLSKLMGLLTLLSIPSIRKLLQQTNKSSCPMTAYRRYLSTLFHMCIWYDGSFQIDSRLWESIRMVRSKHNEASKRGRIAGIGFISQKDMALTQFGFMGFALARTAGVGIHEYDETNWRAFIHVWRVIGYVMGIEERFNICKGSVEETKAICNLLMERVLKPHIMEHDKEFLQMGKNLINGMWAMQPTLEFNAFLGLLYKLLDNEDTFDNNNTKTLQLTYFNQIHLSFMLFTLSTMRFAVLRIYHNLMMYLALWLMHVFPFLAYYKFGYSHSHVEILPKYNDSMFASIKITFSKLLRIN